MIVVAIFLLLFFVVIPDTILSSNATEQINSITTNNANANINDIIGQGYISISRGNFSQAIGYFDKVLKIQPNNVKALNGKNTALEKLEKK